jgi:serine/threonine protein kinase
MGKQGCGGVFNSWSEWSEQKLKTKKDSLVMQNLEKLCERVVFRAPRVYFGRLIASNCKGNVQDFIEALSILRLTSMYKDRVLEILPKADIRWERNPVSTYDALMNGKPCLLKVYRHSKDEVMKANTPATTPLRKEIEIVKVLNALAEPCPNLLQLLGSSVEAPMHMIIERGSKGDLLAHLKYLNNPETQCLIQIALDICNAMMFLDSHDIIHRDLRAKNCFVFMENGNLLAKLGGFQLAAIVYAGARSPTAPKPRSVITTMDKDFPSPFSVPWMAVETLQYGEFSSASDVWSYGVLLFEIFTLGCQPYVNMPSGLSLNSDKDVREYVSS